MKADREQQERRWEGEEMCAERGMLKRQAGYCEWTRRVLLSDKGFT